MMSTVAEYAPQLNMSAEDMLELCKRAGLTKETPQDALSADDKRQLFNYMRKNGTARVAQVRSRQSSGQVEIPRATGPGRNRVKVQIKGKYRVVAPTASETPEAPTKQEVEKPVEEIEESPPKETSKPEKEKVEASAAEPKKSEAKPRAKPDAPPRNARKAKSRTRTREDQRNKADQDHERQRTRLHIENQRRPRHQRPKKRSQVVVDNKHQFMEPTKQIVRDVAIGGALTVAELAMAMTVKASEVIKTLLEMGETATINDTLAPDVAELVVEAMGHKVQRVQTEDVEAELLLDSAPTGEPQPRPPVVTIMGHVDHGKTSLLDYIRKTRVAAGEAGGITQHIGAYQLETERGQITFLDTPGHAAFTAMRARGARCTDLVVLVVAADDGVKPQTEEAVRHAHDAKVPLIVAINKMDRDNADPDRVRTDLASLGVQPEEWGGDTVFVPVSAKTGEGIPELLEAISLQAELLDLKAPNEGMANGVVIESSLDKGRGATATVLVQAGCLRRRDLLLCGQEYGRVRTMFDDAGQTVKEARPSFPVLVLGLSGVPQAGDPVHVLADEQKVREVSNHRKDAEKRRNASESREAGLAWATQMGEDPKAALNLIIKADVRGSNEALREALDKLSTEETHIKIVLSGIGGINESDALLADASKSVLLGFNVRADSAARRTITDRGLDLRYYNVIYELIDDVKEMLEKQLAPEVREEMIGLAEVRDVFHSSKMGAVAGCRVSEGSVQRGYPIRVLRDHVVIYEGELESLRRHKDDVEEVASGTECGIAVANYNDVQVGDQIEVYRRVETARKL